MNNKNRLSIIIPCFNEEDTVSLFYKEVEKSLKSINNYELIFVNDGSSDKTQEEIEKLSKKDTRIKYISFSRNFGKEAAMYAGLCNANGEYIGFIDADLQHPPKYIPKMLSILEKKEYDAVACKRVDRKGDSKIRTIFAHIFYKLVNKIAYVKMDDGAGDYRLFNRDYANALISLSEHNRFSKGLYGYIGFKTYWIEYENVDRVAGKTSWKFTKLIKYAFDGIISFSDSLLDGILAFGALILLISLLLCFVNNVSVSVETILFALGFETIALGILAQYIKKINYEVNNRPHYIIRKSNIKNIKKVN